MHHRGEIADAPHITHLTIGQIQFIFASNQSVSTPNAAKQIIGLSNILNRADLFHDVAVVTGKRYQAVREELIFLVQMITEGTFEEGCHWRAFTDQRTINVVTDLVAEGRDHRARM